LFFRGLFTPEEVENFLGVKTKYIWDKILEVDIEFDKEWEKYPLKYFSRLQIEYYLVGQLLKDSDFMGMANSVEIRVPFLDKDLVELAFDFNDNFKYNPDHPKYLLTNAFEHILPKEIVFRKKQGFTFPFTYWLKDMKELSEPVSLYGWSRGWAYWLSKNWEGLKNSAI